MGAHRGAWACWVAFVLGLTWAAPSAAATANDPAYYIRKDTWIETLCASREALSRAGAQADRTPLLQTSAVIRGGHAASPMFVDVRGRSELYLYVLGAPEVIFGAATWADARLTTTAGKTTRLCELKGLKLLEGQLSLDANLKSGVSGPLQIAGRTFQHGVHVYPNGVSKLYVPLNGQFKNFECELGIDDWVDSVGAGKSRGAVRFVVADAAGAARLDLWQLVARDFSDDRSRREQKWQRCDGILDADWRADDFAGLAQRYAKACERVPALNALAGQAAAQVRDAADLARVVKLYYRSRELDETLSRARQLDTLALRLAIDDLSRSFVSQYSRGPEYSERLTKIEAELKSALTQCDLAKLESVESIERQLRAFDALQREALLANPLLDFDRMLVLKRKPDGDPRMPVGTGYGLGEYIGLPRQTSKHDPGIDRYFGWDNEIAVLSAIRPDGELKTLYRPEKPKLINDVDLHWDADRLLFSMPGTYDKWQVFEATLDGRSVKQLTPADQPDIHCYDACYLPNGRIAFLSTACLQGVPCNAGVIVGMMYTMNADGSKIRQTCFEQDHDYCPTVMSDGRILYMRWDYTDTPHVWNRMLFTCNPDGTGQMEFYGANSYWPNAIFYAKPIPNDPNKVVGIVTGHHVGRVGELVVFDHAKSHFEADGVVQRIPGRGKKVEPLILDKLTEHSWPKFLHPYPLNDKYFIVSCKPTPDSLWGIYLVDVFDNMVLLKELEGHVLLEPIPIRKTLRPPVIPESTNSESSDATVYLQDVYQGPAMQGVPRGTVKKLRVVGYHFAYQRIAGIDHRVGSNGPWEVKRVLGTVDIEPDGSAFFRVPAKTPFTVQPLDTDGHAVQLMRSWMTAMPGETLSCGGCHDSRLGAPPVRKTMAQSRAPQEIRPWYGAPRGFSFRREVQPVLDKYCVSCHDGKSPAEAPPVVDLRAEQGFFYCYNGEPEGKIVRGVPKEQLLGKYGGIFEPSYIALRRYVRVPGLESDLHALAPMEFHGATSELVQLLRKGHHNVKLDAEAWDRLATWIDLNAPCHGTWKELTKVGAKQCERRGELQRLFGGLVQEAEDIPELPAAKMEPVIPQPLKRAAAPAPAVTGWPFDAAEAKARQAALGETQRTVDLGGGMVLEMIRIPAGTFVMGDAAGAYDELPLSAVAIEHSFWIGRFEITNEQFARFDPSHDSRYEHRTSWIFSEDYLGWPLNRPKQPVVRISWKEAMAFCQWLSEKTGQRFSLPTEAQWEYACRAGTATPCSYGDLNTNFAPFANLADYTLRDLAYQGWRPKAPDLAIRDARFNDHTLVTAEVGSFQPNAWGICDMHGNAAEWTRAVFAPYPYVETDGRNDTAADGKRVVRGGSWFDRPLRARSASRGAYQPWQKVFNVGFRVMCEEGAEAQGKK
ncbi:MAG TPA: SUMF1/EgtB/PvdO family nonheme iron enzyme [Planctomycetota bacterium]